MRGFAGTETGMLGVRRCAATVALSFGLAAAAMAADQPADNVSASGLTAAAQAAPSTGAAAPVVPSPPSVPSAAAAPSRAAEPSSGAEPTYEETVAFIEGNLRHAFAEHDNHCDFIYRDNDRFSANSLNSVPEVSGWSVTLKCAQAKPCIDPRNSSRLAKELRLEVRDFDSAKRVGKAMSHLISLCGGTKVRANLFD